MKRIGQDRDSNKSFVIFISTWNFPGSSWWILETGQVFCLHENTDGTVAFKLDDHNYLTVLDGKLIMQEENKDKESLLNFYSFPIIENCFIRASELFDGVVADFYFYYCFYVVFERQARSNALWNSVRSDKISSNHQFVDMEPWLWNTICKAILRLPINRSNDWAPPENRNLIHVS